MPRKGQRMSDETRAKISAKMKGVFKTEDARLKMSQAKTGVSRNYRSGRWRENLSAALKGKKRGPMSPEAKAKLSDWMKRRWEWIREQSEAQATLGEQYAERQSGSEEIEGVEREHQQGDEGKVVAG